MKGAILPILALALSAPLQAARAPDDVRLLLTHISPADILLPTGRRNWGAIYGAAAARITEALLPS